MRSTGVTGGVGSSGGGGGVFKCPAEHHVAQMYPPKLTHDVLNVHRVIFRPTTSSASASREFSGGEDAVVAVCASSSAIFLVDPHTASSVAALRVSSLITAMDANASLIAAGCADGSLWLWSWRGELLSSADELHADRILCVAVNHDNDSVELGVGSDIVYSASDTTLAAVRRPRAGAPFAAEAALMELPAPPEFLTMSSSALFSLGGGVGGEDVGEEDVVAVGYDTTLAFFGGLLSTAPAAGDGGGGSAGGRLLYTEDLGWRPSAFDFAPKRSSLLSSLASGHARGGGVAEGAPVVALPAFVVGGSDGVVASYDYYHSSSSSSNSSTSKGSTAEASRASSIWSDDGVVVPPRAWTTSTAQRVAASSSSAVVVGTGRSSLLVRHTGRVTCVAAGEASVLTSSADCTIACRSLREGEVHFATTKVGQKHSNAVPRVRFNPVYALCATCSHDGTAKVWDVATGRMQSSFRGSTTSTTTSSSTQQHHHIGGSPQYLRDVAFHRSGKILAVVAEDNTCRFFPLHPRVLASVGTWPAVAATSKGGGVANVPRYSPVSAEPQPRQQQGRILAPNSPQSLAVQQHRGETTTTRLSPSSLSSQSPCRQQLASAAMVVRGSPPHHHHQRHRGFVDPSPASASSSSPQQQLFSNGRSELFYGDGDDVGHSDNRCTSDESSDSRRAFMQLLQSLALRGGSGAHHRCCDGVAFYCAAPPPHMALHARRLLLLRRSQETSPSASSLVGEGRGDDDDDDGEEYVVRLEVDDLAGLLYFDDGALRGDPANAWCRDVSAAVLQRALAEFAAAAPGGGTEVVGAGRAAVYLASIPSLFQVDVRNWLRDFAATMPTTIGMPVSAPQYLLLGQSPLAAILHEAHRHIAESSALQPFTGLCFRWSPTVVRPPAATKLKKGETNEEEMVVSFPCLTFATSELAEAVPRLLNELGSASGTLVVIESNHSGRSLAPADVLLPTFSSASTTCTRGSADFASARCADVVFSPFQRFRVGRCQGAEALARVRARCVAAGGAGEALVSLLSEQPPSSLAVWMLNDVAD